MFLSTLKRGAAFTVSAVLLAGVAANATQRATVRPPASALHIDATTPGLEQVLIEGGTLAANYDGNLADILGLPIVCTGIPGDDRDCAAEENLPAKKLTDPQYLYAAVGTGGAQLDFVSQKSGAAGKTASTFPEFADSLDAYSNTAPFGFAPWAGTTSSTFTEDSIHAAAGDAPIPLGPAASASYVPNGFTIYSDSLAAFDNAGNLNGPDQTGGGYNANRGPAIVTPVIGTGVSVIFNTTNLTVPAGGLNLTQDDLCGIFTGQITDWSNTNANPTGLPAGSTSNPITIVHRSDGSGTTFLFSYDLSQMCSVTNPLVQGSKFGAPASTHYWGQTNNTKTQGVGTDSNNFLSGNVIPTDATAPEVVWPQTSIGASKTSGVINAVAATTGGIGYVSPSNVLGANTAEANVENYNTSTTTYEPATATTVATSLSGTTSSSPNPPGYPAETKTTPYLYFPFPTAGTGDALVGYSYGYFYSCSNKRLADQVKAVATLFEYGNSTKTFTSDGQVAAFWNLNELSTAQFKAETTAIKGASDKAIVTGKGKYYSPVTGLAETYGCTAN